MKTLILIALLVIPATAQSTFETKMLRQPPEKRYFTEYDKFKDVTTVRSPNFTVNDLKGKLKLGTGIMLVLQYAGRKPGIEKQYHLVISGMSADGRQFTGTTEIIALVDGKRIDMSATDSDSEVKRSNGLGILFGSSIYVDEKLLVPVRSEILAVFRDAKTIEIQAGRNEFALHSVALTIFKNMLEIASQ